MKFDYTKYIVINTIVSGEYIVWRDSETKENIRNQKKGIYRVKR